MVKQWFELDGGSMPSLVLTTDEPPDTLHAVPQPSPRLFHAYPCAPRGRVCSPSRHQGQVPHLVTRNEKTFLAAGTGVGNSLATAVPLLQRLPEGPIRRQLLMCPAIALMQDERRMVVALAEITGLEVGQLQGGMSGTKLRAARNEPVVLATLDDGNWLFRNSVKYSGLLVYGLALVDEAPIFNGLMLRNLISLWERVQLLAARLRRRPRSPASARRAGR